MNFAQLYDKLLNVLAEDPVDPQYWTETELKGYLNDGQIELVRQTELLQTNAFLDKSDIEDGAYFLPPDIIKPLDVQFQGKPLDKKSKTFLASAYAGTAHQRELAGAGFRFGESWRNCVGLPRHWFFENLFVKVFPKPSYEITGTGAGGPIATLPATVYSGHTTIQLPAELPHANNNLADLYLSGVYQNKNVWSINPINRNQILLTFNSPSTMTVEVVYQKSAVVATKHSVNVFAGDGSAVINGVTYNSTTDSVRAVLGGTKLTDSKFSLLVPGPNQLQINFTDLVAADAVLEITVYYPLSASGSGILTPNRIPDENVTMDYIRLPIGLEVDEDEPEIPNNFHDACWQWAAFLALSKEGEMTQDLKKAEIYLNQFRRLVGAAGDFTETEIDIEPAVQMPWSV